MFDRFDICEAYYLFAYYWHDGQWSPEYEIFGRLDAMKFKPKWQLGTKGEAGLSTNGRYIYRKLMERKRNGEQVVRSR
jgi:hypothetical protein